jgi:hypothetical protein
LFMVLILQQQKTINELICQDIRAEEAKTITNS